MTQIERLVYLRAIDTMWIEHLNAMEAMREGIGLQGYGQRDPLVEYKAQSYHLFLKLMHVAPELPQVELWQGLTNLKWCATMFSRISEIQPTK